MSDYKPQVGDRVRVTLEDTVTRISKKGKVYLANAHQPEWDSWFRVDEPTVVSVEKIEPPVVTFGPGDVVRRKRVSGSRWLILDDGRHVDMRTGEVHSSTCAPLTSDGYEKIELP